MNFDHYGYPVFPGDRGYSSSCGDVDRFDRENLCELSRDELDKWLQKNREAKPGCNPDLDTSQPADSPM